MATPVVMVRPCSVFLSNIDIFSYASSLLLPSVSASPLTSVPVPIFTSVTVSLAVSAFATSASACPVKK
jgi:hypothetical protein